MPRRRGSDALVEHRERGESAKPVSWWTIKPSVFRATGVKKYWEAKDEDAEREALTTLAKALGAHRVAPPGEHVGPGEHGGVIDNGVYYVRSENENEIRNKQRRGVHEATATPGGYRATRHMEDAAVELTDEQAEAVVPLLQHYADAVQRAFRAGAREGRSILHALASGETTISEFDDASARYDEDEEPE